MGVVFAIARLRQDGTVFSSQQLGTQPRDILEGRAADYLSEARASHAAGKARAAARATLNHGWALEQLGQGVDGIERGEEALRQFRDLGDAAGIADTQHALGIWRFHSEIEHGPVRSAFVEAAALREVSGDLLQAAQSWHNLAYTELASGQADASNASYGAAEALLDRAGTSDDEEVVASADRQRGFILSHRAYWSALYAGPEQAVSRACDYLDHERRTGRPKEAALAHLAMGSALATGHLPDQLVPELADHQLGIKSAAWLSHAFRSSDPAAPRAAGANRSPYLGVHLRAGIALARFELMRPQPRVAEALIADMIGRADARGWPAEVRRLSFAVAGQATRADGVPSRSRSKKYVEAVDLTLGRRSGLPAELDRNVIQPASRKSTPEVAEPRDHDSDDGQVEPGPALVHKQHFKTD